MGLCLSTTKVSGSNSNSNNNNNNNNNNGNKQRNNRASETKGKESNTGRNSQQTKKPEQQRNKGNLRRPSGVVSCGKRTDFGYARTSTGSTRLGSCWGMANLGTPLLPLINLMEIASPSRGSTRTSYCRFIPLEGKKHKDGSSGDLNCFILLSSQMILPIAVEDVKREVKILQALTGHENVVQFYNAFEDDTYVYIVMELCEGGELLDRILAKKDSRYSEKDAAIIVRQMLKVAAECHLHGLVHRDMKPENFLFKSTKEDSPLKATDFGLSDFIKPGRKFTDIVGSAYYVAPEVLKRKSGPESDAWSIGVITYILLCGRRPFWDKTEDGIFKERAMDRENSCISTTLLNHVLAFLQDLCASQVLKNKPDFRRKPWPSISNSAKDFIQKLLVKDPRARLTAAQALSHPWVREGGDASDIPVDISVLSNMRQFVKYSRLKQFALRALASTLNEEELAVLRDQFAAIDVDKSGSISLEEMKQALEKDLPWKMKEPRVHEILQAIDSNTDGFVDFSEFVAAALHVHQMEEHDSKKWEARSRAAFEKFDVDKDGFITAEELRMHTGLRGSIDPLLEEADIDRDGKISLSEFRRLLRTASMSSRNVPSPSDCDNSACLVRPRETFGEIPAYLRWHTLIRLQIMQPAGSSNVASTSEVEKPPHMSLRAGFASFFSKRQEPSLTYGGRVGLASLLSHESR
ncbi:hypothetical protein Syun_005362 [Stephania yunnanensis]|uniref:Uncharacterized protein n=1 Tax=Stephania yunnanensis TaxID=152371 RepID=A0AAP0L793_9MAGN